MSQGAGRSIDLKGLRERHLDQLLAEELESSLDFAGWFAGRVLADRMPDTAIRVCTTEISHHRLDGETDVLVRLSGEGGFEAVIHLEDKISAVPQPGQATRYASAVERESGIAASALIAPSAWLRRHPEESGQYGACISFEDAARAIGERAAVLEVEGDDHSTELARRLRWRQAILDGSARRRTVHSAILSHELGDWNRAAAELIDATNGLCLEVAPRQRSDRGQKRSRFIRFLEDLKPYRNGRELQMQLKTAESRTPGRISLEVRGGGEDGALAAAAEAAGYVLNTTPAGTLVISGTTPELGQLTIAEPVSEQISRLEEAAQVAQELIEWWQSQSQFHSISSADL